jgi:lipopolysaccharide assembly outer membrane protein LptD (OstA)
VLAVGGLMVAPSLGEAQVRVPTRQRPTVTRDTVRRVRPQRDSTSRRDSIRAPGDSAQKKDLVEWLPEDSVMTSLLNRQDATATRYQANEVVFQAQGRGIILNGDAAVQRDQSIIVSDTILYSDSTKIVIALGDTAILRDPAQGPADVVALGRIAYDIQNRRGVVTNVSTSVQTGETWFLNAKRSYFQGDSSETAEQRFYARNGTLTSCSDQVHPDYYFKAKEIKLVQKRILVARPAVLYIEDVPVAWLPFIFQDLHTGRRSGILPPRIGISDIVRNNPNYSRRIENIGYYWVLGDYADASSWIDWQSGARTVARPVRVRQSCNATPIGRVRNEQQLPLESQPGFLAGDALQHGRQLFVKRERCTAHVHEPVSDARNDPLERQPHHRVRPGEGGTRL